MQVVFATTVVGLVVSARRAGVHCSSSSGGYAKDVNNLDYVSRAN